MVLRRGPFGMFMSCPDYSADPPSRTGIHQTEPGSSSRSRQFAYRRGLPGLRQAVSAASKGSMGSLFPCSGYPKCKYVKQNLIEGMKCPKCGTGDLAERKARRGNVFWGCTNYPKCDFTSNNKPVPQAVPGVRQPVSCREEPLMRVFISSARIRRRPARKTRHQRLPRRLPLRPRRRARSRLSRKPWCAVTPSALATHRLRRRRRRMVRWWRRRAGRGTAATGVTCWRGRGLAP